MGIRHRLASMCTPSALEARALRRRAVRAAATVLMYHEVLPDEIDLPSWLVVKESEFERQMVHLRDHYDVIALDDALARMDPSAPAPGGARPIAVISFDDGYSGNYRCALPILRRLGLPFTVYIATSKVETGGRYWYDDVICALLRQRHRMHIETSRGLILYSGRSRREERRWSEINGVLEALKALPHPERDQFVKNIGDPSAVPELRMMTTAELASLASERLVTIGNHTHTHALLDQVPQETARAVIEKAQERLQAWTGLHPRHFCYPNGNYIPETIELVRELGFVSAVTTRTRLWRRTDPVHEIPRLGIGRFDNLNLFRARTAGLLE